MAAWLGATAGAAAAETRAIADPAAFRAALDAGASGDTLVLAGGDYGELALRPGEAPAEIRSADPSDPAVFYGANVRGCVDLRVESVVFAYRFDPADRLNERLFEFFECQGLALVGNRMIGDRARGTGTDADGHGYGIGLAVRFSDDVLVAHNHFSILHRGLVISETTDLEVRANEVTQIRMDGMNFAQVIDARIEDNHIHDFDRAVDSVDHADMIQFWTASTKEPSRNVLIRGNLLDSGNGAWTQSIFMRNEQVDKGQAGQEMFYRDITIEENVIYNAHIHGITVGESQGVRIRRNTMVQNPGSATGDPRERTWVPAIRVSPKSSDVTVEDNVTGDLLGLDRPGWRVSGNLVVQNRSILQPNHYNTVFAGYPVEAPRIPESFRIRAGLPGVGATRLRP